MSKSQRRNKRRIMVTAASVFTIVAIIVVAALLSPKNKQNSLITPSPSPTASNTQDATPEPSPSATPSETPEATPSPSPSPEAPDNKDEQNGVDRRSTRKLDVPVKALYLNPNSVRTKIDHYIELANKTEINAYVIDIKTDSGRIMYDSNLEDVNNAKGDTPGFDIREVTKKLHDNNIIVIARMVTFKDSTMTKHKPELAIKTDSGEVFKQKDGAGYSLWLDATNKGSWEYIASVAKEAIQFGFDEIQFDYIRFPEVTLYDYKINLEQNQERHDVIEGFIRYARNSLPEDTIMSADIFGMPLIATKDYGQIGQSLETIGMSLDYVCPMIYPSHYANDAPKGAMSNKVGQAINGIKFTHPDLKPYEVVYNTLLVGKGRIEKKEGYNLNMRPYIQGFTASYLPAGYWKNYGAAEYKAQIKAVYDAGYSEWIFWNSPNDYIENAFLPE